MCCDSRLSLSGLVLSALIAGAGAVGAANGNGGGLLSIQVRAAKAQRPHWKTAFPCVWRRSKRHLHDAPRRWQELRRARAADPRYYTHTVMLDGFCNFTSGAHNSIPRLTVVKLGVRGDGVGGAAFVVLFPGRTVTLAMEPLTFLFCFGKQLI